MDKKLDPKVKRILKKFVSPKYDYSKVSSISQLVRSWPKDNPEEQEIIKQRLRKILSKDGNYFSLAVSYCQATRQEASELQKIILNRISEVLAGVSSLEVILNLYEEDSDEFLYVELLTLLNKRAAEILDEILPSEDLAGAIAIFMKIISSRAAHASGVKGCINLEEKVDVRMAELLPEILREVKDYHVLLSYRTYNREGFLSRNLVDARIIAVLPDYLVKIKNLDTLLEELSRDGLPIGVYLLIRERTLEVLVETLEKTDDFGTLLRYLLKTHPATKENSLIKSKIEKILSQTLSLLALVNYYNSCFLNHYSQSMVGKRIEEVLAALNSDSDLTDFSSLIAQKKVPDGLTPMFRQKTLELLK